MEGHALYKLAEKASILYLANSPRDRDILPAETFYLESGSFSPKFITQWDSSSALHQPNCVSFSTALIHSNALLTNHSKCFGIPISAITCSPNMGLIILQRLITLVHTA